MAPAGTFAQVVGGAAQADPYRFTAVLESLPDDINPIYTIHILRGLSQAATPEQSLRAVRAARTHTGAAAIHFGQLIGKAAPHLGAALLTAAGLTEDELLEILRQLLAQPSAAATADDTGESGSGAPGPADDADEDPPRAPTAGKITGEKIAEPASAPGSLPAAAARPQQAP